MIVISDDGLSLTASNFSGRIMWLENAGTDDGDWVSHDIGSFPDVASLKGDSFCTVSQTLLSYSLYKLDILLQLIPFSYLQLESR